MPYAHLASPYPNPSILIGFREEISSREVSSSPLVQQDSSMQESVQNNRGLYSSWVYEYLYPVLLNLQIPTTSW